jgi:multiple sugar transport system substrate-binding protein
MSQHSAPTSPSHARRRILRVAAGLATVATAAALLTACTSGTKASPSGSPERTVVTMWDQTAQTNSPILNELISVYNASQHRYTLKRQFIAGAADQFTPNILNAIKGRQAPDLVFADSSPATMSQIVSTGKVVPLDGLLSTGGHPLTKNDFGSGMIQASTVDDKLYSLPTEAGNYALFYNKQMFAAAGIGKAPATWAEVAADAKKLTTGGAYGIYLPLGPGEWPVFVYEGVLDSAGGALLNGAKTKAAFAGAAGVKALSAWTDIFRAKAAYPTSLADSTQSQGEPGFDARKVAMFIGNVYNIKSTAAALGADNVGVAPFPKIDKPGITIGTNVSFILKSTSAQQAGAWDFLSWFHQPAQMAKFAVATGYLPTNLKAQADPGWKAYVANNPYVSVFAKQLGYGVARPAVTSYSEISAALNTALNQAMTAGVTPQAALSTAATTANSALQGG